MQAENKTKLTKNIFSKMKNLLKKYFF